MSEFTRTFEIPNRLGLHARAAGKLARLVGDFESSVQVAKGGESVDGDSIMGLMTLEAVKGTRVRITVAGSDAEAAMAAIAKLIEGKFEEGE